MVRQAAPSYVCSDRTTARNGPDATNGTLRVDPLRCLHFSGGGRQLIPEESAHACYLWTRGWKFTNCEVYGGYLLTSPSGTLRAHVDPGHCRGLRDGCLEGRALTLDPGHTRHWILRS
jgi:hypothetical protein